MIKNMIYYSIIFLIFISCTRNAQQNQNNEIETYTIQDDENIILEKYIEIANYENIRPNFANGNGTIISIENIGNKTRTLRKHIQRIQIGEVTIEGLRIRENLQIYSYPKLDENLSINELIQGDYINIEHILEINIENNYFVWANIRKDNDINGWIFLGEYEYRFATFNVPYLNNRWEILDIKNINNNYWTIRKMVYQDVSVWDRTVEIRNNPGLVDTEVISEIITPKDALPLIVLEVIAATEELYTINGITDRWLKIEHNGIIGWVFGGDVGVERGGPKYFIPDVMIFNQLGRMR